MHANFPALLHPQKGVLASDMLVGRHAIDLWLRRPVIKVRSGPAVPATLAIYSRLAPVPVQANVFGTPVCVVLVRSLDNHVMRDASVEG